jgi:DNA-binding PadR family transcriptional regulator
MRPASSLGEFEVLVILAVLHLVERGDDAYGSAIRSEIENRSGRSVPRGSLYVTLDRLEGKGLLISQSGGGTEERRHQPKRLFRVTAAGSRAAHASVSALARMHKGLESVVKPR